MLQGEKKLVPAADYMKVLRVLVRHTGIMGKKLHETRNFVTCAICRKSDLSSSV